MAERHAHRRCPVRERRVAQAGGRVEVRIDAVVRYVPKRGDRLAGSRRAGGVPQHQDPQTRRERPVMAASFDPAETTADVIIVGSGAAGGMAAYSLTRAGLRCLMLEEGDRKRVVAGKSVSVSVDPGGRRIIKKTNNKRYRKTKKQ